MTALVGDRGIVEQAIALVAVACGSIQTRNGYQNSVRKVGRHLPGEDDLPSLEVPSAFVVRTPGARAPIQWQDGDLYWEELGLDIVGFVRIDGRKADDFELATRAEGIVSDFKKLAMADVHFGDVRTATGGYGIIHNSRIVDDANDGGIYDRVTAVCGIGLVLQLYFDGAKP